MAKRGGTKHLKRIASPKAIPVHDKKARHWIIKHSPGPHSKRVSIPLGVLVRDILKLATTLREVRKIICNRMVEVDGKPRTDEKFPVGLMDIVSIPKSGKHFRMSVDSHARIVPVEISKDEASAKLLRVVQKHTISGGKISLTLHDGRNLLSDNHVHVGDSVLVSVPKPSMKSHFKCEKGARCLIMEGKHAGTIVTLKEIIERKGGKPSEALVQGTSEDFITVARYLFVVGDVLKAA